MASLIFELLERTYDCCDVKVPIDNLSRGATNTSPTPQEKLEEKLEEELEEKPKSPRMLTLAQTQKLLLKAKCKCRKPCCRIKTQKEEEESIASIDSKEQRDLMENLRQGQFNTCDDSVMSTISEESNISMTSTDSKQRELLEQLRASHYTTCDDSFGTTISSEEIISIESYQPPKSRKVCRNYLDIRTFAAVFVDQIINDSITVIDQAQNQLKTDDDMRIKFFTNKDYKELYTDIISWPSIEDFSVELGFRKLHECIDLWKLEENWKYSINCLGIESDDSNDYYKYEAIFSLPCKQYPIPQVIARIFYTVEASKVKPKQCIVNVYYNYEGSRLVHHSRNCEVHEPWLFHILDSKLRFFQTLFF